MFRRILQTFDQVGEAVNQQQSHILGKHREKTTHQKARNRLRIMACLFPGDGQLREPLGDFFRYTRATARQVT